MMPASWSQTVKPLVNTNIHRDFGRIFAHVKISCVIDELFFILCDPLTGATAGSGGLFTLITLSFSVSARMNRE